MTKNCNSTPPTAGHGGAPASGTCTSCVSVVIKSGTGTGAPCTLVQKGKISKFKAEGIPSGGTFKWTVTGNVSINGSNSSQIVEVKGNTTSSNLNDSELSIEYKHNGNTATFTIRLTVVDVKKITATVKATPARTARAGTPAPGDHQFVSTETTETWAANKTLVLIRADLQEVELEVDVDPAAVAISWDAVRASDDHASLGTGKPRITRDPANNKKARLKTDETGSFSIRAFGDCSGINKFRDGAPFLLMPIVMVRPTLVADNSVTHVGHVVGGVGGGSFGVRTGSFNIGAPATEAIHMNATVDVVSGGADGRRLLDRVFAGWINNESQNENIIGNYNGGHSRFSIFASNGGVATGAGHTFLPANPAPVLVAPPLLDSGRPSAGTGGDTATLTSSRIRSRTNRPQGQRWIVEAIDSPGDSAPLIHPAHATRLNRYHFELFFSAYLSFWTNKSGVSTANADPANRVYAVLRSYNWRMQGEWTINHANIVSVATPMSVTISGQSTHNPLQENHNAACEVRPPTGLSLLANDGRV
ncbi:MAG: hypothetical protein OEZ39_08100 [Gammaproteobacteria bacterium]|nr:hypothetical protein [Gammaproteobacteria bacterium]MDH5651823.1 hypothetical protein [Gammaproteobacteria bacterium]